MCICVGVLVCGNFFCVCYDTFCADGLTQETPFDVIYEGSPLRFFLSFRTILVSVRTPQPMEKEKGQPTPKLEKSSMLLTYPTPPPPESLAALTNEEMNEAIRRLEILAQTRQDAKGGERSN